MMQKECLYLHYIDPNPVLILEHRWFHYVTGNVPKKIYQSDIQNPK